MIFRPEIRFSPSLWLVLFTRSNFTASGPSKQQRFLCAIATAVESFVFVSFRLASVSARKPPSVNKLKLILFLSSSHLSRPRHRRLAASEIAKFQDQLIKRLIDDMSSQMETLSPSTGAITVSTHQLVPGVVYDYDWNFARAFLYSLTVLTTIGEFLCFFRNIRSVIEVTVELLSLIEIFQSSSNFQFHLRVRRRLRRNSSDGTLGGTIKARLKFIWRVLCWKKHNTVVQRELVKENRKENSNWRIIAQSKTTLTRVSKVYFETWSDLCDVVQV